MNEQKQTPEETFRQLDSDIREVATEQQALRDVQPDVRTPYIDTVGVSPYTRYTDSAEVDGASVSRDSTVDTQLKDGDLKIVDVDTRITSKVETVAGDYKTAAASGANARQIDKEYVSKTIVTRLENGKRVAREIKNPKAAELVTRLAIKKIKQVKEQEREAA